MHNRIFVEAETLWNVMISIIIIHCQCNDWAQFLCFVLSTYAGVSFFSRRSFANSQSRLRLDCNAQWCPRKMFRIITIVYYNDSSPISPIFLFFFFSVLCSVVWHLPYISNPILTRSMLRLLQK